MRRDFELFGEVLFIDRLGRSLNTKGWPSMTTAMLDGDKRVCLASEAITIAEQVDAYAWKIRMTYKILRAMQDFACWACSQVAANHKSSFLIKFL